MRQRTSCSSPRQPGMSASGSFPGSWIGTPSSIVHPVSRTYLSAIAMTGAPERSASMSAAYQRPYFFAIGSFEQRKNATVLVQAWERIGPRADLVLIGQTDELVPQQLNESPSNP